MLPTLLFTMLEVLLMETKITQTKRIRGPLLMQVLLPTYSISVRLHCQLIKSQVDVLPIRLTMLMPKVQEDASVLKVQTRRQTQ